MKNTITLEPIQEKVNDGQLTPEELTRLEFQFSLWRWHLWTKNLGSYNTIERKVKQGKLTPFVCPVQNCDCEWKKESGGAELENEFVR